MSPPRTGGPAPLGEPRREVALRPGYHSPQVEVEVRLNTNESPEPPPPAFVEALAQELHAISLNRYPDREAKALRAALAAHHGVEPAQVFCANGSNEAIQCLLLAYGGPGRPAMMFEPTYALHSHIAALTGTPVVAGRRDDEFKLDPAEVVRTVAAASQRYGPGAPSVSFLCSPNNPTGGLETPETIRAVLGLVEGIVAVDEAYGQFAPFSALELLEFEPRLVVVRTFSKTWAMAGLRLGYAVGDPGVIASLFNVALPYHLDALKQAAGRLALGFDDEMRARVAPYQSRARPGLKRPLRARRNGVALRGQLRPLPCRGPRGLGSMEGLAGALGARPRRVQLARARRLPARHDRHEA